MSDFEIAPSAREEHPTASPDDLTKGSRAQRTVARKEQSPSASVTQMHSPAPPVSPPLRAISTIRAKQWRSFRTIHEAIAGIGDDKQLIEHWLPAKGISIVLAERSTGKTLLLVDQALSFATDQRDWHGFPMTPGRFVVYLAGESEAGTLAAAEAWCARRNIDIRDETTRFMFVLGVPNLLKDESCASLIAHLRSQLPSASEPIIYIDTWQRATSDSSQNNDDEMQKAIRNAELIGTELDAPVVIACHPPKTRTKKKTVSGSAVIENSSVAIWQMEGAGQAVRTVKVTRIKGDEDGAQLSATISTEDLGRTNGFGKPVKGAVLKFKMMDAFASGSAETGASKLEMREGDEELLIAMLEKPSLSYVIRAEAMDWYTATRKPNENRVRRKVERFVKWGLASLGASGSHVLTEAGEAMAKDVGLTRTAVKSATLT